MRNLLALIGAAVLTFGAVGWYLGWYKVKPAPISAPGHQSLKVDINHQKIKADLDEGEQKAKQVIEDATKADAAKHAQSIAAPLPKAPK